MPDFEYFITHIVPDGPESYLGIPGPLSVGLSINKHQKNSSLLTSSTNKIELLFDSRITGKSVTILKKYQWGTRLATGLSPNLWFAILTTRKNHIFHFHFSRSINSAVIALILMIQKRVYLTQTHGSVISNDRVLTKLYDKVVTKKLLRKSSVVIALQENEKRELMRIALKSIPIMVIQNSVQLDGFMRAREPRNRILVGFVGHLRLGNNPWVFLETVKLLKNHNKFQFIMIGADGGLAGPLKQYIQSSKLESITIVEHQDLPGLRKHYDEIDVLICPAKTAQAISFLDGISSGALGVTSRDNASWESYRELGVKIVDNSPKAYADYLLSEKLEEDLYSHKRIANCAARLTKFSPEKLSVTWSKVYTETYRILLSNRNS
jgi:glycosyltransferase involved in cell wall biosynthesis